MTYFESGDGGEEVQGDVGDFSDVSSTIANWNSWYNHVSVADRLHLVDVMCFYDGVETRVQVIQKIHNLQPNEKNSSES